MARTHVAALACVLVGCGPGGVAGSGHGGTEAADDSSSDGELGDGDGDGDVDGDDDGDVESGDGGSDQESGDGDGDGDGDPLDPPDDLPPDCSIHQGSVYLDAATTEAEFAALACVEEITHDLGITGIAASDLQFLSSLVRVGGQLTVSFSPALTSLAGLDALEEVGASVAVFNNYQLVNLEGLGSLITLGGLSVRGNPALTSFAGLPSDLHFHYNVQLSNPPAIRISGNDVLLSLDSLAAITDVTATPRLSIEISDSPQLTGDLSGLAGIVSDDLDLSLVIENNALDSLIGLETLTVVRSIDLWGPGGDYPSLAGLDNLTTVTGELRIGSCHGSNEACSAPDVPYNLYYLESLNGLESLVEVGSLHIWGNLALVDIDGLANLETAGQIDITGNPTLPQATAESFVAGVDVLGSVTVAVNGTGNVPGCGIGWP